MPFEVAVFANNSALKSGHGTFVVSFAAKELFGGTTLDVCCFFGLGVGIADTATNIRINWGCSGGVFGGFEVSTDMHVFVKNEVVEVRRLTNIGRHFRSIQFLSCNNMSES